jgi:hypothetical protein
MLVVVFGCEVAPVKSRGEEPYPVVRVKEYLGRECPLDVLFQELGLEVLEDPLPEETVVRGSKAAARYS